MPVVSNDWRDPADWAPAKTGIGLVRDGDRLRIARTVKSGNTETAVCTLQEWEDGGECRQSYERDVKAGARTAAGLPAHRLLLRSLESPLSDISKSAEIWSALLDAAIPFSLEKCVVVFLPPDPLPEGGLRCLAVAAREEDVRDALEEWEALGVVPDLLLPEPLMLPRESGCPVWLGESRSVFVAWNGEAFLGAASTVKRDRREKALARFQQAWKETHPDLQWNPVGPDAASGRENLLETALSRSCFEPSPNHANLRAGPLVSESLQIIHRKQAKRLRAAVVLLLFLLLLWPAGVRFQLRRQHAQLQRKTAAVFEELTGAPSAASGQEVLLAQRFLDNERMEIWPSARRLLAPVVSDFFARVSRLLADRPLVLSRVHLTVDRFEVNVLGEESHIESITAELSSGTGWTADYTPEANGTSRISGERQP